MKSLHSVTRCSLRRALHRALLLALVLSLLPWPVVLPGPLPDVGPGVADAHNLQTRNVYAFFDLDTQAMLDARIAGPGWTPPTPLLQVGDEIGLIIKGVPRDGTTTGVGGYIDFYIPNGVTVIDAAYLRPGDAVADGITGFDRVPMKGQSPIAVGAGPIGAKAQTALINLTLGPNILGVTEKAVADGTGLMRGTIAGVYGDTGIFFSTHPDTAWNTWVSTGGFDQNPVTNDNTITNNSGDVIVPLNKWDAEQLLAFGAKAPIVAIVDTPDQRGNAPWGMASGVAGPQSGYAWDFDWDYWRLNPGDPNRMKNASDQMGPWQRIRYAGSGISKDQAGSTSTALGFASVDGSGVGYPLSPSNPLTPTVSQTDTTSPKVIRWSVGQTTQYVPEYVWVKFRIDQLTGGLIQPDGCPYFNTGAFGGDAGGDDNGKDHLWRYYEPTTITLNGCVAMGKPAERPAVKVGEVFSYKLKFYNAGTLTLTNVVVMDTLPGGVAFISAVPAPNSGPNPLVWNVGTLLPGQKWEATVTVKATATGPLENTVTVTSNQFPPQTYSEITPSGSIPILSQSKSVTPTTVAPGGTVQYTIRIDNIGSGPSGSPLSITEYLPAGFAFVSKDSVTLNGADVTTATTVNTANPNQPVFTVPGAVNAGQSLILKFTAQVGNTVTAGSYCNYYSTAAGSSPRQTTGFQACVQVAAGTIGDTVFRDWDGDGTQDPEDEGIQGVTATLKAGACPGGATVATTTTDASGKYLFTSLSTPATYCVDVTPPAGYTLTTPPEPRTVTLALNETHLTADFGYLPGGTGSIGDKVFEDVGNDGAFDVGDFGIPDVTVWLYEDTNNNGVIDAGADALVATTQSNSSGDYLFSGLATGIHYLVKVDKNDPDIQAYFNAKYDPDPVPYQLSTVEIKPSPNLTGSDLDNDFGFWRVLPASIGDQVFVDNNGNGVYDAGDAPLAGITVTLYRDGQPLATTNTGADGTYLFDNLGPGTYRVIVDTADPDLPAGLFTTVTQYDKTLAAGESYLAADFPFLAGLTKTVDKAYANPAGTLAERTLTFTLKPFYPDNDLLQNVRIIDPLPTGTTYVTASANAGGTFGAYSPIAAVPGNDPGPPVLDTAMSVSTNFVNTGGSVNVTLNVKSSVAISNVSPTDLSVSGGAATCTGPTPPSANVPAGGTGVNFVWSCTLTGPGEFIFSAGAEDAADTTAWPEASSASVLAAPYGGPNVVTWNLGSNTSGVPGEIVDTGVPAGVYALRGANTNTFARFNLTSGAWVTRANTPASIAKGGALTSDGVNLIYALRGGTQQAFYAYNSTTNAWTTLANTGVNVDEGGALVFLEVGGVKYVYALMGNGTAFRRYDVAANTWSAMAATPATVKKGGALTTDGTNIYALRGNRTNTFWRYNVATNTWTTLANVPGNVGWGGALTRVGGFIYALQGDGKKGFYRYTIATNTWTTLASTPGNVAEGGALTTDGTYIYAFQGKTTAFWRYDIAANKWTTLAAFAANTGQGGALTFLPAANLQGRFTTMSAAPTLVSAGHTVQVRMRLQSTLAVNNVVPGALTVTGTGGATASCTGPTPASQNIPANGTVEFTWTCTVTPGANPGSLTFSASATGSGPTSFASATSNSVLVSPVLSFQAIVNSSGAPAVIENTGLLAETSGAFEALVSNTTQTATSGSIGDRVWADADGDGVQDPGELGLAGVKVCIDSNTNGACDPGEPYDITDANGLYRIYGLAAGTYTVRADPATYPAGYLPTTAPVLGVTLTAGQQYNNADFGLIPPGTGRIGDTVWLDADNDGVFDAGETGLPGITVRLEITIGSNWYPVATTTTDATGSYAFTGLRAGSYRVTVDTTSTVTSPYGPTATLAGAMTPTYDRDGIATPHVAAVTLATDATVVNDADFGYNWSGSIGDYVWYDGDFDGVQDAGEPPIAGAFVMLYFDANNNGLIDQANGDYQVAGQLTDVNGLYLFANLPPGNYLVDVYEDSITTGGVRDIVPTTPNIVPVALTPGATFLTADFGYYEGARVEGTVFWDWDGNGAKDPAETTAPYLLPNVTVTITCAGADGILGTGDDFTANTDTDADGHFVFIVPPGACTLTYDPTDVLVLDPTLGVATTPTVLNFVAIAGEDWHPTFDFGVDNNGAIGDRLWHDADGDGIQDAGEPGLAGVTVLLYRDVNNNNLLDGGDIFLAAGVTNAGGTYLFEGLADGNYVVVVNAATLPSGFSQTYDNSGPLDGIGQADIVGGNTVLSADFGYRYTAGGASLYTIGGRVYHDLNNSGNDEGEPGFVGVDVTVVCNVGAFVVPTNGTGVWTLAGIPQGSTCTVLDADETDLPRRDYVATETPATPITVTNNITGLDFGYRQQPGSISGRVCVGNGDGRCDDPGDTPLPGVTVTLRWAGPDGILNTADDVVTTTTTNALGVYTFPNLQPGLYQIVQTNLTGYSSLADADGGNPDSITQMSDSGFLLGLGENAVNRDFEDQQNDGVIGNFVWYDADADGIQDPGESGISGVAVELWQVGGSTPFSTTVTGPTGFYTFTVPPGDYYLVFTPPPGFVFSPADVNDGNPNPDERDSDPNITTGQTAGFTLPPGGTLLNWDAGFYQTDVALDKLLNTPNNRTIFYVGEQVTFQIVVENIGDSAIALLPLLDTFDNACLQYTAKSANPQESTFDNGAGTVEWVDLTLSFLQDLAPGAVFTVTIPFDVVGSSNDGFNAADIIGAFDSNGNPVSDVGSTIEFICVAADFGDAPDPTYPTLLVNDGARHVIVPGFHLGATVDSEPNGQPNAGATGDDLAGAAPDDEDGVIFGPLVIGQTAAITVTASAAGRLDAWLDFGDDGSWAQPGDRIFTNQALVAGPNVLTFTVPLTATVTTQTFARFRFSSTGGLGVTGLAGDGEVEDYAVAIQGVASIGDFIFFDSNGNGAQDPGETIGIDGVPVSATNLSTGQVYTTISGGGGFYLLSNLPPGTYSIVVPASVPGLVRTTLVPLVVTVVAGQTYTQADFGYIAPTGVALVAFTAEADAEGILLRWQTLVEDDLDGFVVWRASQPDGDFVPVSDLIPAQNRPGAAYTWRDVTAGGDRFFWYRLEARPDGEFFGPIPVIPAAGSGRIFLPRVQRMR